MAASCIALCTFFFRLPGLPLMINISLRKSNESEIRLVDDLLLQQGRQTWLHQLAEATCTGVLEGDE